MALDRNGRRLAGLIQPATLAGTNPAAWWEPATVTAVQAGAASDGNALVTVLWRGTAVQAPYLATYTPVVGHTVLLAVQLPQVVIVGRVIGTP